MQITIKTLKNEVFKIESEVDVDVAELKKKVEEHDKNCQAALQKLIYQVCSKLIFRVIYDVIVITYDVLNDSSMTHISLTSGLVIYNFRY